MTYDVTYMRCVCVSSLQASVGPGRGHMPLSAAHHHRGGHRLQSKCVCVRETNKHRATDASDASCCYVFWH